VLCGSMRYVRFGVKAEASRFSYDSPMGTSKQNPSIQNLVEELRHFAALRDWDQFHSPKNLATALSVEAGELLEQFQWLTDDQSRGLTEEQRDRVIEEVADVFLYLLRLSDKLDIDLVQAAAKKIALNAIKYPVEKARGTAKKYSDLK
jgi:dCTP diphosphatase